MSEKIAFVSKAKRYKITMSTIKQHMGLNGELVMVDKGCDIEFQGHHFETSNAKLITFLRESKDFGLDFYEEKKMSKETKAKLDKVLVQDTIVKAGVVGTSDVGRVNLDVEKKKLAADREAFEKEKADFDNQNSKVDKPSDDEGDAGDEEVFKKAPSKKAPAKKAKGRKKKK